MKLTIDQARAMLLDSHPDADEIKAFVALTEWARRRPDELPEISEYIQTLIEGSSGERMKETLQVTP